MACFLALNFKQSKLSTRLNFLPSITCLSKLTLLKMDTYFALMSRKHPTIRFCLLAGLKLSIDQKIALLSQASLSLLEHAYSTRLKSRKHSKT